MLDRVNLRRNDNIHGHRREPTVFRGGAENRACKESYCADRTASICQRIRPQTQGEKLVIHEPSCTPTYDSGYARLSIKDISISARNFLCVSRFS
jgi:hypothetical protein